MSEALYKAALLLALLVIAISLWQIATVNSLEFVERRLLPTPDARKPDDDAKHLD